MRRAACLAGVLAGLMLAPARSADDQVGVVTHFDQDWKPVEIMPLLAELGAGWIRDGVSWGDVEPVKHQYVVPAKTAAWIEAAHAQHLHVLLVLYYANKNYTDPFSPPDYANAAAFLAKALAGRIDAIEILNEPNNAPFGPTYGGTWNGNEPGGKVAPWVKKYAELLKAAVAAIKAANPDMKVIGYGASPPATFRIMRLGIPPRLDGITDHPYSGTMKLPELVPYPGTVDLVQRDGIATADREGTYRSQCALFRAEAAKDGLPQAKLWNTEWGFATWIDPKANPPFSILPDTQAVYIVRRLLEARALGVMTFYYDLRDDGTDRTQEWQDFGLVDYQRQRKPAFAAFQRFTALFAGLEGDGTADGFMLAPVEANATRCYAYHAGENRDVWVACWDVAPYPDTTDRGERWPQLKLPKGNHAAQADEINLFDEVSTPLEIKTAPDGGRYCAPSVSSMPEVIHFHN